MIVKAICAHLNWKFISTIQRMELRPVELSCEKNYGRTVWIRFLNEELVSNNWVARTSISYHTHIAGSTVLVSRQQNRDGIPVFFGLHRARIHHGTSIYHGSNGEENVNPEILLENPNPVLEKPAPRPERPRSEEERAERAPKAVAERAVAERAPRDRVVED